MAEQRRAIEKSVSRHIRVTEARCDLLARQLHTAQDVLAKTAQERDETRDALVQSQEHAAAALEICYEARTSRDKAWRERDAALTEKRVARLACEEAQKERDGAETRCDFLTRELHAVREERDEVRATTALAEKERDEALTRLATYRDHSWNATHGCALIQAKNVKLETRLSVFYKALQEMLKICEEDVLWTQSGS